MEFNHGKLLVKFSHGDILNKLEKEFSNSDVDNMRKEYIEGGICYMLSLRWLLNLFNDRRKGAGYALPSSVSKADLAYYKQIAGDFCKYSGDFYKTVTGETDYSAAEEIPLTNEQWNKKYIELCSEGAHTMSVQDIQANTVRADQPSVPPVLAANDNSAFLVSLDVPDHMFWIFRLEKNFGHELALWVEGGTYFLFDPNYGVYVYDNPGRIAEDIFEVYAGWYKQGGPAPQITFVEVV